MSGCMQFQAAVHMEVLKGVWDDWVIIAQLQLLSVAETLTPGWQSMLPQQLLGATVELPPTVPAPHVVADML